MTAVALSAGCWPGLCIARGTQVLTPKGARRIEELAVGDLVYAVDEDTGERVETPITAIRSAMRETGFVEVDGVRLCMTSDHPTYCPDEDLYAPAGDWFLGRRTRLAQVTESGLRVVEVTAVEPFVAVQEVFDITVEHELHNFVANTILVHNKSPANNNYAWEYDCVVDGFEADDGDYCECEAGEYGTIDCGANACVCGVPDAGGLPTDQGSPNNSNDIGSTADTGADAGVAGDADMTVAPRHRGSCVVDADCSDPTWSCISIPADDPNGYHTCQPAEAAPPNCGTAEPPDECCVHAECTTDPSGTCVVGPIFYCGGVAPTIANACLYDECTDDNDCGADELCLPPRVLAEPVSRCVAAGCRVDADCTDRAAGQCEPFFDPCNGRLSGFFCTYEDSECRSDSDCAGGEHCAPGVDRDGNTACMTFQPPP